MRKDVIITQLNFWLIKNQERIFFVIEHLDDIWEFGEFLYPYYIHLVIWCGNHGYFH